MRISLQKSPRTVSKIFIAFEPWLFKPLPIIPGISTFWLRSRLGTCGGCYRRSLRAAQPPLPSAMTDFFLSEPAVPSAAALGALLQSGGCHWQPCGLAVVGAQCGLHLLSFSIRCTGCFGALPTCSGLCGSLSAFLSLFPLDLRCFWERVELCR